MTSNAKSPVNAFDQFEGDYKPTFSLRQYLDDARHTVASNALSGMGRLTGEAISGIAEIGKSFEPGYQPDDPSEPLNALKKVGAFLSKGFEGTSGEVPSNMKGGFIDQFSSMAAQLPAFGASKILGGRGALMSLGAATGYANGSPGQAMINALTFGLLDGGGETLAKGILPQAVLDGEVKPTFAQAAKFFAADQTFQQVLFQGQNIATNATNGRSLFENAGMTAATALPFGLLHAPELVNAGFASRTMPESKETLLAQQDALVEGRVPAMMFPAGTAPLPLPEGMKSVATDKGVFHYDPDQTDAKTIIAASDFGRENEVLALGSANKEDVAALAAKGEPVSALTEQTPEGTEVRTAAVTPTTEPEARAAMEAAKGDDNTITQTTPQQVLDQRLKGLSPKEKATFLKAQDPFSAAWADIRDNPPTDLEESQIQDELDEHLQQQDDARAEAEDEAFGSKTELLDAVKQAGGIPTSDPVLQGEIDRVKQGNNKGMFLKLFRKNAKSLHELRESLNDQGFRFDDEAEMLEAIEDRVSRGKKQYADHVQAPQSKSETSSKGGIDVDDAHEAVSAIADRTRNSPKYTIVDSADDLPDEVKAAAKPGDGDEGFFYKGKVYLMADQLESHLRAAEVFRHEMAHAAVRGQLGRAYGSILDGFWDNFNKSDADRALNAKIAGLYGLDATNPASRRALIEERLARVAESDPSSNLWRTFVFHAKRLLNSHFGASFQFNDADARALVSRQRDFLDKTSTPVAFSKKESPQGEEEPKQPLSLRELQRMTRDTPSPLRPYSKEELQQMSQRDPGKYVDFLQKNDKEQAAFEEAARVKRVADITSGRLFKPDVGPYEVPMEFKNFGNVSRLWESAPDRFRKVPGLEFLGDAIDRQMDTARAYGGRFTAPFRRWEGKYKGAEQKQAYEEFYNYQALKDKKVTDPKSWDEKQLGVADRTKYTAQGFYDQMSPAGKDLVATWSKVANEIQGINQKNKLTVWDDTRQIYRPIGTINDYFPRSLKPEVFAVLKDPIRNLKGWNEIVRELLNGGYIDDPKDAEKYLSQATQSKKYFYWMGNIEAARTMELPTSLYDYSLDAGRRYIRSWSERMAQIEAYGQKVGPDGKDLFDIALQKVSDPSTRGYIEAVRDRAYNRNDNTPLQRTLANLGAIASATQLTNPETMLNILGSGVGMTGAQFGLARSTLELAKFANLRHAFAAIADAREKGAIMDDLMNMATDAESAVRRDPTTGELMPNAPANMSFQKGAQKALHMSGFQAMEAFHRAHTFMAARSFLRYADREWAQDLNSPASRAALGFVAKNAPLVDLGALIKEHGTGPETDKFLRGGVNATQGGYRIDQIPIYSDTPMGKFFFKYQKWGLQMTRNIVKNVIEPLFKPGQVTYTDPTSGKETTVNVPHQWLPAVRFLLINGAVGLGEEKLREWLFGVPDRSASFYEIGKTFNANSARALGLVVDKVANAFLATGSLGLFGNYTQTLRDVTSQQKVHNPLEPPSFSIVNNAIDFVKRAMDERTLADPRNYHDFLKSTFSLYRTGTASGAKLLGTTGLVYHAQQTELARQDVRWVKPIIDRYLAEIGDKNSANKPGSFSATPKTPFNTDLKEALWIVDASGAQKMLDAHLAAIRDPAEQAAELKSIKASARNWQPVRVGNSPTDARRALFLQWAEKRLPPGDLQRVEQINQRYNDAAQAIGLLKKKDLTDDDLQKALKKMTH